MDPQSAREQISSLIHGYWKSQAVYVAAKLRIADLLTERPQTAQELAEAAGAHGPSLYRLLRALASIGIFTEDEDGRFSMTPPAEPLRSDVPGSKWAMAVMMGEEHFNAWGDLLYTVETGQPAFDRIYGEPIFEFLMDNPGKAKIFDRAMVGVHGRETAPIVDAYDFSQFRKVADVGGGNGSLLRGVLERHRHLEGILFDLPHVVERANAEIEAAGLADRVHLVAGDFFQSVPSGADAYLLRHIIHDWDDDRAIRVLENIHQAMPAEGRLLVVESVIPPGNESFFGKWLDLTMMVIPGGKERTEAEYRRLFDEAGFHLRRIVPTSTEISLIEGEKV